MTAGEQWAAEQLDDLRAARFTPRAWQRFLRASFTGAKHTRRARTGLARQTRAWAALGLAADPVLRAWASAAGFQTPTRRGFVTWWLAVCVMLDWHLGMVEGPAGEQRDRLAACDALTLARLWSLPHLGAQSSPAGGSAPAFAALIGLGAASDALDGVLARRAGPTRLGRDLDKAADALVVAVACRAARRAGWLPTRTARLATARSVLPVAVAAGSYFATGHRPAVDTIGPGRLLAPVLLGGLAAAPFAHRTGALMTGGASALALALAATRLSAESSDHRQGEVPR